ncbi:hypothetical protein UA08_06699 [Talaromyces atroroseus]|uniref:FAD dependent oxidoreductase domain-containing protein n=1 Tax=Talaromyces atroroseus TaxID=1441469 RepID=A0A225AGJ9_TALAT|nr:hypothetical protein UA08_06699 [Talaromyces atroroseus]OKL58293.1 hypothetical protein UA08_06699 [Talaromyces atroroseus]
MSSEIHASYLIIGAGVFGASTALHLAKKYLPPATDEPIKIILVDRPVVPYHTSASQDQSKVIRADYAGPLYTRLALEAKHLWRSDSLYKEIYHETGLIWADMNKTNFAKDVIANYQHLGIVEDDNDAKYRLVPPSEIRRLHNGLFSRADLDNIDEIFLNASSGWVEANKTLQNVIDAAVCTGVVKHIEAEIARLIFDDDGHVCTGAQTVDGQIILLIESVPEIPELHVGSRLSAAGLITGILRLSQNEASQLRSAPAFLFAGGKSQENELKITCDISFTNTVEIFSKVYVSMPPEDCMSTYSVLSAEMNRALAAVRESILGDGTRNHSFEDRRICWDAITPDQNFIISAHPHCRNLFIATGGSFHAWKFLPILGKYVVQMLEDRLDPDLAQRWFWNRDFSAGAANERMMPVRELTDIGQ